MDRLRRERLIFALGCALIFLFSSCEQFFSTSLGTLVARPIVTLPETLTPEQALEYARISWEHNDIELAEALVPKMAALVSGGTLTGADLDEMKVATLRTLIVAEEIGAALYGCVMIASEAGFPTAEQTGRMDDLFDALDISSDDLAIVAYIATIPADSLRGFDAVLGAVMVAADVKADNTTTFWALTQGPDVAYDAAIALTSAQAYFDAGRAAVVADGGDVTIPDFVDVLFHIPPYP